MLPQWICLIVLMAQSEALRVLVVFPFSSPSHNLLGRSVVRHLLEANHEVVHMTSFPYEKSVTNLTEISLEGLAATFLKETEESRIYSIEHNIDKEVNIMQRTYYIFDFHKRALANDNVTRFLSDPNEKFDVILMEWFFADFFSGIPPLFKCPYIWIGSTDAHWQILSLTGEVTNPAYIPDIFDISTPTTFWERVGALFSYVKKYIISKIYFGTLEKSYYNTIYPSIAAKKGVSMPSYEDALYNASLVFINSDPALGMPHNLPLNAKYIGGYHMNTDLQPMPQHLQNIMDNAKHGVIFFSLGSHLESKFMPNEMIQSLLTMFSKLKQTVIWKFEDKLQNVPANVYLQKWAPQLNILAHPNLKIFITHGGRMSMTEAVYYGVPVIGIPVFGDQFLNIKEAVEKKVGIEVSLKGDLAVDLGNAIKRILDNPMYTNKARELSSIYRHRLVSPGQELVYWTEHVAKSRGAEHLRPTARKLPMYQKLYLDFMFVVMVTICLAVYVYAFVRKQVSIVMKDKNS